MSARSVHLQVVMWRHQVLLSHFATATQEGARVTCLCLAQSGEKLCFGAADMPVARIMARQGFVRGGCCGVACMMPIVVAFVGQVWADVGVTLMCAVGAVSV